jgi:hypothetical protein
MAFLEITSFAAAAAEYFISAWETTENDNRNVNAQDGWIN